MVKAFVLAAGLAACGHAAQACRLALVLAMDVSSSVDEREDALQRNGVASALLSPDVRAALFANDDPVALAIFEWSGRQDQRLIQDWVLIENVNVLTDVANTITSTRRIIAERPTALGYALGYAASLLARAPNCATQTIDVSGDGLNNDGFEPRQAYDVFDLAGVTVNGLVIVEPDDAAFRVGQIDLPSYYAQELIQGPGAFVEIANGFDDFARAIEAKLIRELGVLMLGQSIVSKDHQIR